METTIEVAGSKKCVRCEAVTVVDDFHNDKRRSDGKYPYCKECTSDCMKEQYAKRRAKILETKAGIAEQNRLNPPPMEGKKECTKCGETKELSEFGKDVHIIGGVRHHCKACLRAHYSDRVKANPDLRTIAADQSRERYKGDGGRRNDITQAWRRADRHRMRAYGLKAKYNMTLEEYDTRRESQGGLCAKCGKAPEGTGIKGLVVDHDHETGAVRGLLCSVCNSGIGKIGDSLEGALEVVRYFESIEERARAASELLSSSQSSLELGDHQPQVLDSIPA